MKVEANKIPIKPEPIKAITIYKSPDPSAYSSNESIVKVKAPTFSSFVSKKIGVLYSDQDKECAEKIMSEVDGIRIRSPLEVSGCKYIIWVVSAESASEYLQTLDMATLYPEKFIIFWWRAVALEAVVDVTMANSRKIRDAAFAFFPLNGTYIFANAPTSFTLSLKAMSQWIKQGHDPQGKRIRSLEF